MQVDGYAPTSLRKTMKPIKEMSFQEEDLKEESPIQSVAVGTAKGLMQWKNFKFKVSFNCSTSALGSKYNFTCQNFVEACYHYEAVRLVALQPTSLEDLLKIGNYQAFKEITLGAIAVKSANASTAMTSSAVANAVVDEEEETKPEEDTDEQPKKKSKTEAITAAKNEDAENEEKEKAMAATEGSNEAEGENIIVVSDSDTESEISTAHPVSVPTSSTQPSNAVAEEIDTSLAFFFFENPWQYFLELGSWILMYYDQAQTALDAVKSMDSPPEPTTPGMRSSEYSKRLRAVEEGVTFQKLFIKVR
jgi:hypothetical protein